MDRDADLEFISGFADSLRRLISEFAPEEEDEGRFWPLLEAHFGEDPTRYPVVGERFPTYEHANLHLALESLANEPGSSASVHGVFSEYDYGELHISNLFPIARAEAKPAPVEYVNLSLPSGEVLCCVKRALFLIKTPAAPIAVLFDRNDAHYRSSLSVQALARDRSVAEDFLRGLRRLAREKDIYRGQVISLHVDDNHQLGVSFHHLPAISLEQIILPAGVLDRLEQHTVRFAKQRANLLKAGRHLKRGVLLYGPPGTGKTLSAMHLANQMEETTVILLTGRGMGLIEQSCAMARMLAPAIVILEDVDLVAVDRRRDPNECSSPLLFELLNQMDGLSEDLDVVFLLTTNRPEVLEPALASRPGRIDAAIEIPLPDKECRARLLELYGRGLDCARIDRESILRRTEGVSAAFIRELVRKAAFFAAEEGDATRVEDRHFNAALKQLVLHGNRLTKSLLGAGGADGGGGE